MSWLEIAPTAGAAFLAALVECVEAATIVLAVGVVRGWRSALAGTALSLVALAVLVAALGPALSHLPQRNLQLFVGLLLLLFGMRWLRKAILRGAGLIALHDEAAAFEGAAARLSLAGATHRYGLDALATLTAFKAVLLEGVEVVFIVLAVSAGGPGLLGVAVAAALAAAVLVAAAGVALHRPLARVPENTLKLVVGVLLSGFGTFWVGEGAGFAWPGPAAANPDLAIPCLMAAYLAIALCMVPACRSRARAAAVEG